MSALPAPDIRQALYRPELAEQALEGQVRASAFRAVVPMYGHDPVASVFLDANPGSERIDQLLAGEVFDVLDEKNGRVWGRIRRHGQVGWIETLALSAGSPRPTHQVCRPGGPRPLNALISDPTGADRDFIAPIGSFALERVAVAEILLGVPHALGARSSLATDCSGLVQQTLLACGHAGARRSDEQALLGQPVSHDQAGRNDLVIWLHPTGDISWTGHSALMQDHQHIIHATGYHGAVVREPLSEVEARLKAEGFDTPVFRRLRP